MVSLPQNLAALLPQPVGPAVPQAVGPRPKPPPLPDQGLPSLEEISAGLPALKQMSAPLSTLEQMSETLPTLEQLAAGLAAPQAAPPDDEFLALTKKLGFGPERLTEVRQGVETWLAGPPELQKHKKNQSYAKVYLQSREVPADIADAIVAFQYGDKAGPNTWGGLGAGLAAALGTGALATAAAGSAPASIPAALTFLGANLLGGAAFRETANWYDDLPNVFDAIFGDDTDMAEYQRTNVHTPTDIIMDAAFPYVARGAGQLMRGVGSMMKGEAAARKVLEKTSTTGALTRSMGGIIEDTAARRDAIQELLSRGPSLAGPEGPGLGQMTGASEGMGFALDGLELAKNILPSQLFRPIRVLMNSDDQLSRMIGRQLLSSNLIRSRMDIVYPQTYFGPQFNRALESSAPKGLKGKALKAWRQTQEKKLIDSGYGIMGRTPAEVGAEFPELYRVKLHHDAMMSEVAELKRAAGVKQTTLSGEVVDFTAQPDYVPSIIRKDFREVLLELIDKAEGTPEYQRHVDWLLQKGMPSAQIKQFKAAMAGAPTRVKGLTQQSRLYDEAGNPLLPNEFYEPNLEKIVASVNGRDDALIANAAAFGSDVVEQVALGGGTAGKSTAPKMIVQALGHTAERGLTQEHLAIQTVARELFAPEAGLGRRGTKAVRQFFQNTMLTANAPLQAAEIAKATAYGLDGPSAMAIGGKLLPAYTDYLGARVSDASGAAESGLGVLLQLAENRGLQKQVLGTRGFAHAMSKLHPTYMATEADSFARRISSTTAIGTVHSLAREAGKGTKPNAAMLKYASEIFDDTLAGEEAWRRLRDMWQRRVSHVFEGDTIDLLPERDLLDAVQTLVGRFHYRTQPGEIANVLRTSVGSIALQFRSFMVQAGIQFHKDVFRPLLIDGPKVLARTGDASLMHLGLTRLIRMAGHQLPLSYLSSIVRMGMKGEISEADSERLSEKAISEFFGSTAGLPGAAAHEMLLGQGSIRRLATTAPGLGFTQSAVSKIYGGLTGDRPPIDALLGANALVGGVYPRAKLALDPILGALREEKK